jgi:citrate lyase subunit beta/citryl-CoA lyase
VTTPPRAETRRVVPARLARSWLLHPADRFPGADARTADVLVLDLEDGVPGERRGAAREATAAALREAPAWVRINDASTPDWREDLAMLREAAGLEGVVLAKAESADDVRRTAERLPAGTRIVPMVESAASLARAEEIAAAAGAFRLAFGVGDFRRDTGIGGSPNALAFARTRLVLASRLAGLAPPIDGPPRGVAAEVRQAAEHTREVGMTGCLVLDPDTIPAVNAGLSPRAEELRWAHAVIADTGRRDGGYAPARARAEALLELDRAFG